MSDEVERLRAELAAARETNRSLNRRVQEAEKALADLLRCNDHLASGEAWCGGSLGRAFLAWGNSKLRERVAELEAALKPFAECAAACWQSVADSDPLGVSGARVRLPTVGDCRRAAELLKDKGAKS